MHVAHNIEQDIARWEKLAEIVKSQLTSNKQLEFVFKLRHPIRSPLCLLRGRTPAVPPRGYFKGACDMAAHTNPTNVQGRAGMF